MKMLLVKNIEVELVPEDIVIITRMDERNRYLDYKQVEDKMQTLIGQVKGQRFVNARGQQICIGMTEKVREAIGLPFEAYDNLWKEKELFASQADAVAKRFNDYRDKIDNANLRRRLRYLFTGKM